jgi:Protein of unknown function (DUF664)
MDHAELLIELFGRIDDHVEGVLDGLDAVSLTTAPAPGANTIGWLVWHLIRVQDHHVAEILGEDQIWVRGDVAARCGLTPDPQNTGYGHAPAEVAAVQPDGPGVLVDYLAAVAERTRELLRTVTAEDLDRVVDTRWDPPVTLGVRLVSIADDDIQHAGQAAYVKGLLTGG